MGAIHELYDYLFIQNTDPRTYNWPFMADPIHVGIVLSLYLLLVYKILPEYMSKRKPYDLRTVIMFYNVFQVVACVYIIAGMIRSGWTTHYTIGCQPVDYSQDPMAVEMAKLMWWTLMLKMIELIETCFFVLRKKYNQVSFLHTFHHISTLFNVWLAAKYYPGGMASFPIIINSCVHVLMYMYYLLATLGPNVQKSLLRWKPKLTIIQMVQFIVISAHAAQSWLPNCNVPKLPALLFVPNIFIFFYLFYDFFQMRYHTKAKKVEKQQ